jgi:SAM-dependent methyltransferase
MNYTVQAIQFPHVACIQDTLRSHFPYFVGTITRQIDEFGDSWLIHFEKELDVVFGENWQRLTDAVIGYGKFSLESMKLQKLFDKTRCYESKSYAEAALEVYQNKDYMLSLYLPGILLSHFLWSHHYKQHLFYKAQFLPRVRAHNGNLFYDVGIGTGFYSKEMMLAKPGMRGEGFDLSPFSMEYTSSMLAAYGLSARYLLHRHNIVTEPVEHPADFIISIEVLEHLEDPLEFLDGLHRMLAPGGLGLISAALTAPNADHIYLYNEPEEVSDQLRKAGFSIISHIHDAAYEPRKATDSVPRNAAFIVTRS